MPSCAIDRGRVITITIALGGCRGAVTLPAADGGTPDAPIVSSGCPDVRDIDSNAAVGKACTPEGTYCLNAACDPCDKTCPAVRCTGGVWARAVDTALCTGTPDAGLGVDSSAPADAGACVDVTPSGFDQTCKLDSDCVAVGAGTVCRNGPSCVCAGAVINVAGRSGYQAELQQLESSIVSGPGTCSCPFFGAPRCVENRCILCGGVNAGHAGCPDGG